MAKRQKQTAKILKLAERRKAEFELRKTGASYQAIADHFGIDISTAYQDVMGILRGIREETLETAADVREMEINRLDRLMMGHWKRAAGTGEIPADEKATAIIMQIMNRRARLMGIDLQGDAPAPTTPVNITIVSSDEEG